MMLLRIALQPARDYAQLDAAASALTGFGVAWGLTLMAQWLTQE